MSEETENTAQEQAPAKVVQPKQNGVSRPKTGTKTGRVWEIADAQSNEAGEAAKRKPVLDAAIAEGINAATAATQYGRWRKFNGLEGNGKEAATTAETPAETEAETPAEA